MMRFLYSIGFTWYIVADRADLELSKVNCKKRIVLPWANAVRQRIEISMELQQTVLKKLLLTYNKPVVIHCAAFQEVIDTKKRLKISVP
jgi:hypothetical protein